LIEDLGRYFEKQFMLADETRLPLFLHDRNTGTEFLGNVERITTPPRNAISSRA